MKKIIIILISIIIVGGGAAVFIINNNNDREKGTNNQSQTVINNANGNKSNPSKEYGYTGNTTTDKLSVGEHLNYYYDKNKEPIECVVIDTTDGIQVVSLDIVKKVKLIDKVPNTAEGYDFSGENANFEKTRYAYNHAIEILNDYTQEFIGDMAEKVRCVGSDPNETITNENDNNNMYSNNVDYFLNWNNKFKDGDSNCIKGARWSKGKTSAEYVNDLEKMNNLKIVATSSKDETVKGYWLASRVVSEAQMNIAFSVRYVGLSGGLYNGFECSINSSNSIMTDKKTTYSIKESGLRPVFHLKPNIDVEKIAAKNVEAGGAIFKYN